MKVFTLIFLLTCFLFSALHAKNIDERLDYLKFKIAIFGPTDEIFAWWGHAALVVEDVRWNFQRVFDWGINSHPNESFLLDFINGEIQYKVTSGVLRLHRDIEADRDIVIYTLNLDRNAMEMMLAYMENRVLPENRYYDYHEFRDNCSTGVRDIINLGTSGQFKAVFDNMPGRFSYRQHVLRYTWFRPLAEWLLSFLMGQNLDEQITAWDEMFLPVEIGRNIVNFSYIDSSGIERNLVSSVEVIHSSRERLPVLNKPLVTWPFFLAAGLFVMILFFLIDFMRKKYPRFGRVIWGFLQCIFGLLFGALGCVLVFGLLMDNDYFQQNINVLFINPLLLIIVPASILFIFNKSLFINSEKLLRIIWTYVFIAGCVTLLARILPFFFQQNLSVYEVVLPIAFVFSLVPEQLNKCYARLPVFKKARDTEP